MAVITKIKPTQDGVTAAFVASTPAGDTVVWDGGDLLLEFTNGHASPITITIPAVQASARVPSVGSVAIPDRSKAVANGATAIFLFKRDEISAFLDTARTMSVEYTGGNAALLVRAVSVT